MEAEGSGGDSGSSIEIKIKMLDSRTYSLHVEKDILVSALKVRIHDEAAVPIDQQRLIYRGKVLQDEQLLSFYNVEDGHTLHMVVRQPQLQQAPAASGEDTNGEEEESGQPGGLVMGFDITTDGTGMPDLNRIVGSMLQSIGLAAAFANSSPASNQDGNRDVAASDRARPAANPHAAQDQFQVRSGNEGIDRRLNMHQGMPPVPGVFPSQQVQLDSLQTMNMYMDRLEQVITDSTVPARNASVLHAVAPDGSGQAPSESSAGAVPSPSPQTVPPPSGHEAGSPSADGTSYPVGQPRTTPADLAAVLRRAEALMRSRRFPLIGIANQLEEFNTRNAGPLTQQRGTARSSELIREGVIIMQLGSLLLELGRAVQSARIEYVQDRGVLSVASPVFINRTGPNPMMLQPMISVQAAGAPRPPHQLAPSERQQGQPHPTPQGLGTGLGMRPPRPVQVGPRRSPTSGPDTPQELHRITGSIQTHSISMIMDSAGNIRMSQNGTRRDPQQQAGIDSRLRQAPVGAIAQPPNSGQPGTGSPAGMEGQTAQVQGGPQVDFGQLANLMGPFLRQFMSTPSVQQQEVPSPSQQLTPPYQQSPPPGPPPSSQVNSTAESIDEAVVPPSSVLPAQGLPFPRQQSSLGAAASPSSPGVMNPGASRETISAGVETPTATREAQAGVTEQPDAPRAPAGESRPQPLGLGLGGLQPLPFRPRRRTVPHQPPHASASEGNSSRAGERVESARILATLIENLTDRQGSADASQGQAGHSAAQQYLLQNIGGASQGSNGGGSPFPANPFSQMMQSLGESGGQPGSRTGPPPSMTEILRLMTGRIGGSGEPGRGPAGGLGGLDAVMGQMLQNSSFNRMIGQVMGRMGGEEPTLESVVTAMAGGSSSSSMDMDFAGMVSQMRPLISQMIGGLGTSDFPTPASVNDAREPGGAQRSEDWTQALSAKEREEWSSVISMDEQQQAAMGPQRALSDAYMRGMPAKRRRTSTNGIVQRMEEGAPPAEVLQNVAQLAAERMRQNGIASDTVDAPDLAAYVAQQPGLAEAYGGVLWHDLAARCTTDPDLATTSSDRFPAARAAAAAISNPSRPGEPRQGQAAIPK